MNFHTFRYITIIRLTVICVSIFGLSSCLSEYSDHFRAEHSLSPTISGEYHSPIVGDDILILPDKKIKQEILESIRNAKNRVWIEIYMWTDKDIMYAMIDAHKRGVDVRVLLERNVYDLPRVNIAVYTELEKAGIPVRYTDSYRFTFTHAKFWIIDDIYYISSGNLTKSFFESNRDWIWRSSDPVILAFLAHLLVSDFGYSGIDKAQIPNHIVLSPIDARSKIEYLLEHAEADIKIYTQTLTDTRIVEILHQKQKAGIHVTVCTADNDSNRHASSGVLLPWTRVKKPYLHGKSILVDHHKIFLGSQNLTTNSLQNNREVGVIISDSGVLYSKIFNSYQKDCNFE